MTKVIYKQIDHNEPLTELAVPKNARFLNVGVGNTDGVFLHFLVNTDQTEYETLNIHCVTDDRPFDGENTTYLGEARVKIPMTLDQARKVAPDKVAEYEDMIKRTKDMIERLEVDMPIPAFEDIVTMGKTESYHLFMDN
jgi:hypothetical protein